MFSFLKGYIHEDKQLNDYCGLTSKKKNLVQKHSRARFLDLWPPDIVDIKPANMEELTEVITAAQFHPVNCNEFIYSSSKGTIRLCDMREKALCDDHAKRTSSLSASFPVNPVPRPSTQTLSRSRGEKSGLHCQLFFFQHAKKKMKLAVETGNKALNSTRV